MEKFPVRLIDVSKWQDDYYTPYKPTLNKVAAEGFMGVIARVGYGLIKDRMFDHFVAEAKRNNLVYGGYWFLDYYSHKDTGMTASEWGIEQAYQCYDFMKADMTMLPLALDCEQATSAGKIDYSVQKEYNECARGFADTWFKLSGKRVMLYCSPGFFWVFYSWAKSLDMWIAWYNRWVTEAQVEQKARDKGFTGVIRMWQYASDGDINDDGVADGLTLGMETSALDLNVYVGEDNSISAFSKWAGTETPIPEPDPTPEPLPTATTYRVIAPSGVNVRDVPIRIEKSDVVGWMPLGSIIEGKKVIAIESDWWLKVTTWTYMAVKYSGVTLMEPVS